VRYHFISDSSRVASNARGLENDTSMKALRAKPSASPVASK
jgi:hypothetical protein